MAVTVAVYRQFTKAFADVRLAGISAIVAHHKAYSKQGLRGSQVDGEALQGLRVARKAL
jgi:hypothetical protein